MTNYQEQIVKLTSSGVWSARPSVSWIEFPISSGTGCNARELVVRIEDNTAGLERVGYVDFTGGSKTCRLTITQLADGNPDSGETVTDTIRLDKSSIDAGVSGVSISVVVTTNKNVWSISGGVPNWITLDKTDGPIGATTVNIAIESNGGDARNGQIVFTTAEGNSTTLVINQMGEGGVEGYIRVTNNIIGTIPYNINGLAGSISVESSSDWTATTTADWITLGAATGNTNGNVLVNTTSNTGEERTATIMVSNADGKTAKTTVTQERFVVAPTLLTVSPSEWDFEETGETTGLTVASNEDWFVAENTCDWLTLGTTSGTASSSGWISLRAEANNTSSRRTGKIVIETTFSHERATATFTQDKTGHIEPPVVESVGKLYCNTNIAVNDGIYTSNLETFPTGYYVVPIASDGLKEIEVEVSGTTMCGKDNEENYNLVFVYPTEANLVSVKFYDTLTSQYINYGYTTKTGFTKDGIDYTMITLTDTYVVCAGGANKFKITFNKGITK